jgi:hypothetical protein
MHPDNIGKQFSEIAKGVSDHEQAMMGLRANWAAKEDKLSQLPSHMVKKDIEGQYVKFKTHGDEYTHIWDGGGTMDHYITRLGSSNGYLTSSSTAGMDISEAGIHKHAYEAINRNLPGVN